MRFLYEVGTIYKFLFVFSPVLISKPYFPDIWINLTIEIRHKLVG